ncbi:MAG: transglycosylase SLT domain-containing protein [Actinomycetota bacterium]|nr:transglycosylase SLT domain-containing protein [Actinomycetota bacterium]
MTATAPTAAGYLTMYPDGKVRPAGSNLNFRAGQTVPNLVVVPVASDGRIQVFNGSGGTVHVVADVAGYYLAGAPTVKGAFQELSPTRLLDTRSGLGAARSPVSRNDALALQVTSAGGILGRGISAIALNVTVTNARGTGWMAAYPSGQRQPQTSNLQFVPGQTVANLVVVPVGADGKVVLANGSSGAVDVIADIVGVFLDANRTPAPQSCDNVPSDPNGTAVTRWNPITLCVLTSLQQGAGNLDDVNIIILNESSGDPNAINLYDSNAQAGHPSEGLIQVIRPTFDQYRSASLANNLYDPAANLYAGLNYAIQTYGSIHNVPGLVSLRNGGGYTGYIVRPR